MKKINILGLGLAGVMAMASAANAAVITLESMTPSAGSFLYNYQATLGPDEGLRAGDKFVIYDFAGYVGGSIAATSPLLTESTEFTTAGLITPGQTDDISLINLVFTYNGADFRNTGGPFGSVNFANLTARSIFDTTVLDAFTTITTKNNPVETENTVVTTLGETQVPGAVPEPASWMMLISGFGLVGAVARRRRTTTVAA